jgi:hypothetical protein
MTDENSEIEFSHGRNLSFGGCCFFRLHYNITNIYRK